MHQILIPGERKKVLKNFGSSWEYWQLPYVSKTNTGLAKSSTPSDSNMNLLSLLQPCFPTETENNSFWSHMGAWPVYLGLFVYLIFAVDFHCSHPKYMVTDMETDIHGLKYILQCLMGKIKRIVSFFSQLNHLQTGMLQVSRNASWVFNIGVWMWETNLLIASFVRLY